MKKLALIGSTKLAQRLIHYISETQLFQVVGMFDDFEEKGSLKYGLPILGKISYCAQSFKKELFDEVLIAIGYNNFAFRKEIFRDLKTIGIPIATFIHPTAHIDKSAKIGEGCIVLVNCVIEMNASLQENVFLSSVCYVSHDATIGAHSYCAPSLRIAGNVTIDECCFLGIDTTIINGINIGENVKSGAGSVIVKDIPSNVLVTGVPALIKKAY